jgi:single-strand DNA-binding protein
VNKVLLTGRLTRDPELRSLASGSSVATFGVATNEFRGNGKEHAEYHNVVVWDRLAQVCGQYLGKHPVSTMANEPASCSAWAVIAGAP